MKRKHPKKTMIWLSKTNLKRTTFFRFRKGVEIAVLCNYRNQEGGSYENGRLHRGNGKNQGNAHTNRLRTINVVGCIEGGVK